MNFVYSINRSILSVILVMLTFTIQGCGLHVYPLASEMIPTEFNIVKNHPYTVSVQVRVTPNDDSQIRVLDLKEAIETSINQTKLFTKVVNGTADYCLEVNADVHWSGFAIVAKVGGEWLLRNCATNKLVMNEFVLGTYDGPTGVFTTGWTRVRIVYGRATKEFIHEGLVQIGKLDL